MSGDNIVKFKGRRDGITVWLDKSAEFETLKSVLSTKVSEAKEFFGNTRAGIVFEGRSLSNEEENQMLRIIEERSSLKVSFINQGANIKKEPPVLLRDVDAHNNMTLYHKGSVRSGQSIRYEGSIVVTGDVNPGAEIIAWGNVIVLGSLKGLVHAGCKGNSECFISALNLNPTQIRISDIITYIPPDMVHKGKKTRAVPSYAYIDDGKIYIAPLV